MWALLRNRILESLLSLACLVVGVFVVSRLTGDPGKLYLPLEAPEEMVIEFNRLHGFDQPIWSQFLTYLGGLARFDLGMSLRRQEPALDVVLEAYPATLTLAGVAIVGAIIVGVVIGCLAALRPTSWLDRFASGVSVSAASIPDFWLALMGILLFAVTLHWLPTSGTGTVWHWILPVVVLMMRPVGSLVQVVRGSMVETLSAPYIDAARGRGVPVRRLLFIHALRNAAIPAITVIGIQAASILNGAVVVETIFGWPGIGRLMITSILQRDFAVVQAAVIVIALVIFLLNFLIDILYGLVDPRVRT